MSTSFADEALKSFPNLVLSLEDLSDRLRNAYDIMASVRDDMDNLESVAGVAVENSKVLSLTDAAEGVFTQQELRNRLPKLRKELTHHVARLGDELYSISACSEEMLGGDGAIEDLVFELLDTAVEANNEDS